MFSNKTAWFSKSCPSKASEVWAQHGGTMEDSSLAQFIFSDDWEHEDTTGFSTSQAYLKQHLAIFKSSYVLDAVQDGSVSLGSYLLIPPTIAARIEGMLEDEGGDSSSSGEESDESTEVDPTDNKRRPQTRSLSQNASTGRHDDESSNRLPRTSEPSAVSISTRPQLASQAYQMNDSGDRNDVVPSSVESSRTRSSSKSVHEIRQASLLPNATVPDQNENANLTKKALNPKPITELDNILRIEDLPLVIGVLRTINKDMKGVVMKAKC